MSGYAFQQEPWWLKEEGPSPAKPAGSVVVTSGAQSDLEEALLAWTSEPSPAPKLRYVYTTTLPKKKSGSAVSEWTKLYISKFVLAPWARHSEAIIPPALEYAAMAFTPDPFGDWIREHRREIGKFAGEFVVIDPERGILGHGTDPVALAREHHRDGHPVMVTFAAPDLYPTS